MKKQEIYRVILDHLREEELVPEDELVDSPETGDNALELKRQERERVRENALRMYEGTGGEIKRDSCPAKVERAGN